MATGSEEAHNELHFLSSALCLSMYFVSTLRALRGARDTDSLPDHHFTFFWGAEHALTIAAMTHMSAFLDPPGTGTRTNLTLRAVVESLDDCPDQLTEAVADLEKQAESLKELRNKCLAHFDRRWATGEYAVDPVSLDDLDRLLADCDAVLREVGRCHGIMCSVGGDAHADVQRLIDGLRS